MWTIFIHMNWCELYLFMWTIFMWTIFIHVNYIYSCELYSCELYLFTWTIFMWTIFMWTIFTHVNYIYSCELYLFMWTIFTHVNYIYSCELYLLMWKYIYSCELRCDVWLAQWPCGEVCVSGAARGVAVSLSAFLASTSRQCWSVSSSLSWGLNFGALVCCIFWTHTSCRQSACQIPSQGKQHHIF